MDFNQILAILEGQQQDDVFGDKAGKVYAVYDGEKLVKKFMLDIDAQKFAKAKGYTVQATKATPNEMKKYL